MTKKKQNKSELLDSLKFINLILKPEGKEYETHCHFSQGFVSACDSVLAVGCKAGLDLSNDNDSDFSLRVLPILRTLEKSDDVVTITKDNNKLKIKSGSFSCTIPLLTLDRFPAPPDPQQGEATDALRTALSVVAPLAVDSAPQLINASLLLRSESCAGTNSRVLLECWHGLGLPTVVLPKAFATVLGKITKPIKFWGSSDKSFTVWFEDNSWLRTQTYSESWPDIDKIFNYQGILYDLPTDFFSGCAKVALFDNGDIVCTADNIIESSSGNAHYAMDHSIGPFKLANKDIQEVAKHAHMYAMTPRNMLVYGTLIRGAISFVK